MSQPQTILTFVRTENSRRTATKRYSMALGGLPPLPNVGEPINLNTATNPILNPKYQNSPFPGEVPAPAPEIISMPFGYLGTVIPGQAPGTLAGAWAILIEDVATHLSIPSPTALTISATSITGQIATFTATNNLAAGQTVTLGGFTSTLAPLNGQVVTVSGTGLSGSAFQATFVGTASGTAGGTAYISSLVISATSFSGQTATFTANNTLIAGQTVTLSGFTSTQAALNGQVVTVLSAGLSTTAFEAAFVGTASGSGTGSGIPGFPALLLAAPIIFDIKGGNYRL